MPGEDPDPDPDPDPECLACGEAVRHGDDVVVLPAGEASAARPMASGRALVDSREPVHSLIEERRELVHTGCLADGLSANGGDD